MAISNQPTTAICLINQKGGCGKSSTCFHLAGTLAAVGQRVLLVDADPQGSISQGFLGSDAVEQLPPGTLCPHCSTNVAITSILMH